MSFEEDLSHHLGDASWKRIIMELGAIWDLPLTSLGFDTKMLRHLAKMNIFTQTVGGLFSHVEDSNMSYEQWLTSRLAKSYEESFAPILHYKGIGPSFLLILARGLAGISPIVSNYLKSKVPSDYEEKVKRQKDLQKLREERRERFWEAKRLYRAWEARREQMIKEWEELNPAPPDPSNE